MPTTIDIIIGKSLSGKTTAMRQILNNCRQLGISAQTVSKLITSTTRPPRQEDRGKHNYNFLNNADLNKTPAKNIIAPRTYQVVYQNQLTNWTYFINRQDLIRDQNKFKHLLLIIDWQGFKDLKSAIKNDAQLKQAYKIQGWYLDIPLKQRLMRLTNPKSPRFNDDSKETLRRLYDDEFNAFNELENPKNIEKYQLKVFSTDQDFITEYLKQFEQKR